jgi:mRNA-degrading endonuclease toxin of MazEF toxin-antitoxin module
MYKCVDERRQLTYSNIPCEKQGLKTDGTVTADRVTTMPRTAPESAPLPTQRLKPPVEMPKDPEKNAK